MKKYLDWIFVVIILVVLLVIYKPYLKETSVVIENKEEVIRTNTITKEIEIFDTEYMEWFTREQYFDLKISKTNELYDNLKIDDYSTLEYILDSGFMKEYNFLTKAQIEYLEKADDIVSVSYDSKKNIQKKYQEKLNDIIDAEREKEIQKLKILKETKKF
ncbi:MAG: hypothetical protein N4A40_14180 [Tissierellales bacterium]|nr:hypothetical protein [Tissierellales bacterium]